VLATFGVLYAVLLGIHKYLGGIERAMPAPHQGPKNDRATAA
jgi:hypothetical protein